MDLTSAESDRKKRSAQPDELSGVEAQPSYHLDRSASPQSLLHLQRSIGNQNVQRLLKSSPHLTRSRSAAFLTRKALPPALESEPIDEEQHDKLSDTGSPLINSDVPPVDVRSKSLITRQSHEQDEEQPVQRQVSGNPISLDARPLQSHDVQRAPKFADTYEGKDQENADKALENAQEDAQKSAGERWKDNGKDFGMGMGDAFLGPMTYAIPAKREKLKEDWEKADNVLAHGKGGWGKFVTGAKRTNIILGEAANLLGWLSMMCMIAAPFTKGLSAVPGVYLSIAAGAINAVMAVLNGIIIVGQGIRMSQLPKDSVEYALAAQSLIDETAGFITNGIGAGLGLAGAGGAKGAIKGVTDKVVKGSVRQTAGALAKPLADDLGKGAAQTIVAGALTGTVGGAIKEGSHKQVKDHVTDDEKPVEATEDTAQRTVEVLQRDGAGMSMTQIQQQEEKLVLMEQLGANLAGDNQKFNAGAVNANQQFGSMDGKTEGMPIGKLEEVSARSGEVTQVINGGGAGEAVTSVGDDKEKVKSLKAQVDQAGSKVGVSVQITAPEPTGEEMKAASQAQGKMSRMVNSEAGGEIHRMADEQEAEGGQQVGAQVDIQQATGGARPIQRGFFSKLKNAFKKVGNAIAGGAKWLGGKIAEFAKKAWAKLKAWVKAAIDAIKNAIFTIIKKIIAAFKKLIAKIKDIVNKGREIVGVIRGEKQQAQVAQQQHQANQEKSVQVQSQIKQVTTAVRQQHEEEKKVS